MAKTKLRKLSTSEKEVKIAPAVLAGTKEVKKAPIPAKAVPKKKLKASVEIPSKDTEPKLRKLSTSEKKVKNAPAVLAGTQEVKKAPILAKAVPKKKRKASVESPSKDTKPKLQFSAQRNNPADVNIPRDAKNPMATLQLPSPNGESKIGGVAWRDIRESIAFLFILNSRPAPPNENSITAFVDQRCKLSGRVLSVVREKELVETLAFVASADVSPRRVAALCIEEGFPSDNMTVKLAVNHGDLVGIKQGFDKIAKILQGVAKQGEADSPQNNSKVIQVNLEADQQKLLETVVAMNQNRILFRLRSRHAKLKTKYQKDKITKPRIIELLVKHMSQGSLVPSSNAAKADVTALGSLFSKFECMEGKDATSDLGLSTLILMVETAHRLCHQADWVNPPNNFTAEEVASRAGLLYKIQKLGHYVTAVQNLLQAARRYLLFRQIKIQVIKLLPTPNLTYTTSEKVVARLQNRFSSGEAMLKAMLRPKPYQSIPEAERFTRAEKMLRQLVTTDCAVHAEIQLLFYYESYCPVFVPRVICSTKKACFLCNLFFSLHGRFFLPSTHGRLYEKWTVPIISQNLPPDRQDALNSVIASFLAAIDEVIRRTLRSGFTPLADPNESTIFRSVVWSMSNIAGTPQPQENMPSRQLSHISTKSNAHDSSDDLKLESWIGRNGDSPDDLKNAKAFQNWPILQNTVIPVRSHPSTPPIQTPNSEWLKQGHILEAELHPHQSVRVKTKRIHLTLCQEGDQTAGQGPENTTQISEPMRFCLRYLPQEEQSRKGGPNLNEIDVDRLAPGSELVIDQYARGTLEGIYLQSRSDAVHLRFWKEQH